MAIRSRKCTVCGREYEYCPDCWEFRMEPSYKVEFDCENCKNIFDICTRYSMQLITKKEAADLLSECDFSYRDRFSKGANKRIDDIMYFESENVIEEEPKETIIPIIKNKKKRNKKK